MESTGARRSGAGNWPVRILALGLLAAAMARGAAPFDTSPLGAVVAAVAAGADGNDPTQGNRLALLDGGRDALLLRIHLIRHARVSIDVQTFIWTNDECGRLVMCELIEAARRGVKVRIVADQPFSEKDPEIAAFLATVHPNFELKHYRPSMTRIKPAFWQTMAAGLRSFYDVNQRMHNKVMLFDDCILITGGRNIENTYYDHSPELDFRDRDVLAIGPVAREAAASFARFWNYRLAVPSRELADVSAVIARGTFRRYATRADYDFGPDLGSVEREADDAAAIAERFVARLQPVQKVTLICDEPGKTGGFFSHTARITRELARALEQARSSIAIQTPYLVLSRPARRLFREIQDKNPGLRIRISTNSFASTDNPIAYSANYRLRNDYVESLGLQVYEFKPQPASLLVLFPASSRNVVERG